MSPDDQAAARRGKTADPVPEAQGPGPGKRTPNGRATEQRRLSAADVLAHCLGKPGAWQDEPWEGDVVAKVGDKIFAFLGSGSVGVKCGAQRAEADEWIRQYPADAHVMAYIGRFGWNTLHLGGLIPDDEVLEAIDASYEQVVAKLPRGKRH